MKNLKSDSNQTRSLRIYSKWTQMGYFESGHEKNMENLKWHSSGTQFSGNAQLNLKSHPMTWTARILRYFEFCGGPNIHQFNFLDLHRNHSDWLSVSLKWDGKLEKKTLLYFENFHLEIWFVICLGTSGEPQTRPPTLDPPNPFWIKHCILQEIVNTTMFFFKLPIPFPRNTEPIWVISMQIEKIRLMYVWPPTKLKISQNPGSLGHWVGFEVQLSISRELSAIWVSFEIFHVFSCPDSKYPIWVHSE